LGGFVGGGFFVEKVDINRNRISADKNAHNLETIVETALAKTVFTIPNIFKIRFSCLRVIHIGNYTQHGYKNVHTLPSVPLHNCFTTQDVCTQETTETAQAVRLPY